MNKIKCPVCNKDLKTITYESQEVDVCPTCGGIWFDKGEFLEVLNSMLSQDVVRSETLQEAYKKKASTAENINQFKRYCPRCKVELEVFNYSYDSNVFLDRCPVCSGVWAEKGELEAVASYLKGDPEVYKLGEAIASELNKTSRPFILSSKKAKVVAVIIASFYLIIAPFAGGLELFLHTLAFLVISLACIFFGEDLGRVTGVRFAVSFARPVITKPTPGFIVVIGGWLVLLSPLFVYIVEIFAEM